MFTLWYVLALVVSLVAMCYLDKKNHGEVTVGDFLINLFISVVPVANFGAAIIFTLWALYEHGSVGGWMDKRLF